MTHDVNTQRDPPPGDAATAAAPAARDVVVAAARAFERDRYLAALLAPREVQDDLVALAAFGGEIARIPGYVSEPMLGEIRLQWWRDRIDACGEDGTSSPPGARSGHPIADALGAAIGRHRLPASLLQGQIDAHGERLSTAPFSDLPALRDNLVRSEGAQFALAARVIGVDVAKLPPMVLDAAGIAYGLARLAIELPATLSEHRCLLPRDLVAATGLEPEALFGDEGIDAAARITPAIAEQALLALAEVRTLWPRLPPRLRTALAPLALVRPYLRVCQKTGHRPPPRDVAPLTRVWRIWLTHCAGSMPGGSALGLGMP